MASRPDYLLATNRQTFSNLAVRDNFHNRDQYMVLGFLRNHTIQENNICLGGLWRFPMKTPAVDSRSSADTLFGSLRKAIPHPYPRTSPWNACISQDAWYLIYQRAVSRRETKRYQLRIRRLSSRIRDNLGGDHLRQVTSAGGDIEALLSSAPHPSKGNMGKNEGMVLRRK